MANDGKFLNLTNGKKTLEQGIDSSAGVADAGKIIVTDASGQIDATFLPASGVISYEASENLDAGDYVNLFDDSGTVRMRKADNSNERSADGYVLSAVTALSTGTFNELHIGQNTSLSGLTLGTRYFLGTAGDITATPPTGTGETVQCLGVAVSTTTLQQIPEDQVLIS
jgi:hypothetical protein